MSSTATAIPQSKESTRVETQDDHGVPWGAYVKVIVGIALVYLFVRIYMHTFAYSKGLDYF
jgi:hypothetical protein